MAFSYISTHAPYTEGDSAGQTSSDQASVFQLTPPIQRATQFVGVDTCAVCISTHAPYTEGDAFGALEMQSRDISTHAPYTEGDGKKTGNIAQFFAS